MLLINAAPLSSARSCRAMPAATGYDGAVVSNAGRYSWNATWSRWVWIGSTGLGSKLSLAEVAETPTAGKTPRATASGALTTAWISEDLRRSTNALSLLETPMSTNNPNRVFDFVQGGYGLIGAGGALSAVAFADLLSFTRASAADYTDRFGSPAVAPAGVAAFGYGTCIRGLLCYPIAGARAADQITSTDAPQRGCVYIRWYHVASGAGANRAASAPGAA